MEHKTGREKNARLPRAGHIIILSSLFPFKPASQFRNDRVALWRTLTVKVLTVNGDTDSYGDKEQFFLLFFSGEKSGCPLENCSLFKSLGCSYPVNLHFGHARGGCACFPSVLIDWDADILLVGGGQSLACELGVKSVRGWMRGGKVALVPLLCL